MNYYYDLPNDIISKIEDIVKEEELIKKSFIEWKMKMMIVNYIFDYGCDFGDKSYTDMIEQGMTYREMVEQFDYFDYNGKFLFNVAEDELYIDRC
jgi:hypothetical protein